MWIDEGRKLCNEDARILVERHGTENKEKSRVIEGFNRAIKEQLFNHISANKKIPEFVDVLDILVDQYNNAIHSSTKITPKEAHRKEDENKVWRNFYPELGGKTLTPKFSN